MGNNVYSTQVELFRVLYAIYSMTKGHQKIPIIIQLIPERLGFDMSDQEKYGQLHDNMVYLENEGYLTSYRGTFITNLGFDR